MSSTKKTIPFFYAWTDPSQVGNSITAPTKPWDGTPWASAPPILGFAPDTEAAAQFVNYLHKQHDTSDLQLHADQVQRELSSVIVAMATVADLRIDRSVWDPLARRWLHVGRSGASTKRVYQNERPANGLSDITPGAPEWGSAGAVRSICVPRNVPEAIATKPAGGNSRFWGVVCVDSGAGFQVYRVDSKSGSTDVLFGTAALPGFATGLPSADCSLITQNISGGNLFSICTSTGDGQFHILETAPLFGAPIMSTTSYPIGTVYPYSRFRYVRSPDESLGEGYGDVDCIFEIGSWGAGNPHKVFRRRWGTGVPVWTKQNEPFATTMNTSGGVQATVLGVGYDRRLQGLIVAVYRYDGSNKGVEFLFYDPQSGSSQTLAVSTHVWDDLNYRDGINVNGPVNPVYPCAFEIYNDTWIILVGGTTASTMPIFSFDVGATWHAEPSGTITGTAAWAQGPGALSVAAPEINAGGRGFIYRPSMVVGSLLGLPVFASSPAGGGRVGPYT